MLVPDLLISVQRFSSVSIHPISVLNSFSTSAFCVTNDIHVDNYTSYAGMKMYGKHYPFILLNITSIMLVPSLDCNLVVGRRLYSWNGMDYF